MNRDENPNSSVPMATAAMANQCSRCGSTTNLGFITCRHATVCLPCAKPMAQSQEPCSTCGVAFTLWQKEYPLRLCSPDEKKKYFAAAFENGLPDFANDHQWSMNRQSQSSDANAIDAELLKDPWILENESGIKYKGKRVEPTESSDYYFLRREEDGSFVVIPCSDWFRFDRVHHGTQPTTEQAEETMEKYNEKADNKIEECNKRFRTGQRKPTSTSENNDEKGEPWDHDGSSSDEEDVGDPDRYHVPSAMRDFEDQDREAFLSNSGRDMKNILTKVKESEKKVQDKGSGSGEPST
ncbi:unnamed protein product [Arabidopsis halleri]